MKPENWFTPCSLEQYAMFEPISGSSAFMIVAYIRAYEATGTDDTGTMRLAEPDVPTTPPLSY